MRRRPPGSAAERMRAGKIAGGSGCERGRACPRAARSDRHFLVDLVGQSRSDGGVGGRFYFAPVRQGGSNRRDADVAITTIKTCIEISPTATGCFLRLGRIVLGHCSSPSNSQFRCRLIGAPGSLGGTVGWRASAAEMRNKSCRSMTFQTAVPTRDPCPLPGLTAWPIMGKPRVKTLLSSPECCSAGNLSRHRVQTAAFLQQVLRTIESKPPRRWNWRVLLV
jgi:hypothetical protein